MGTSFKGGKKETLALETFIKLVRACNSFLADVNQIISENNLTESQFGVLEALLHLGPMSQKQLAGKLLKSGGNITMVIDNLSKRGLVTRERNIIDRRFFWINLTAEGEELITRIFPDHVINVTARMQILSDKEQGQLGDLCKKLGLNFKEK